MNEVAKKIVARAARAEVRTHIERLRYGATVDEITTTAWQYAIAANAELRQWHGAQEYFETVFQREVERRNG